jgi:hypothetical protein
LDFDIGSSSESYTDLNDIRLWIKGKIVDEANADFGSIQDERYSMVNYGLHSLFSQVNVEFNNVLISQSSNCYGYR